MQFADLNKLYIVASLWTIIWQIIKTLCHYIPKSRSDISANRDPIHFSSIHKTKIGSFWKFYIVWSSISNLISFPLFFFFLSFFLSFYLSSFHAWKCALKNRWDNEQQHSWMRSNSFLCYFVRVTQYRACESQRWETLKLFAYAFSSRVGTAREPVIRKFENCIVINIPPYFFRT